MINIEKLVRPNILELQPYSNARDEYTGKEGIFLDANENPYGTLNRYPDPYQNILKRKLAERKGVSDKNIFVGNGSDEVIDLAFRIFCNPGYDKALAFSPTYGMYDVSASVNDVKLLKLSLNQDFQIDLEKVKPCLGNKSIKLIFICSPNNPTGNLMNRSDVEFILNNFNGVVIVDEAYIDFTEEQSFTGFINQYNNLLVSQTFSKAWGLAAVRVGTAYANEDIIALYNKVKPPYNVSKINQQAAIDAIDSYPAYEEKLAIILAEKERLITELRKMNIVKRIYPSDANFMLLEVDNAEKVYAKLVDQQIIVRNRNRQVKNCIRVSVGTPEENNELLEALKNIP
jgi:histidinol-phosphate aminotransferase